MTARLYYRVWVRMRSPLDGKPVSVELHTRERADADLLIDHLTARGVECGWTEVKEGFYVCPRCGETRRCACDK